MADDIAGLGDIGGFGALFRLLQLLVVSYGPRSLESAFACECWIRLAPARLLSVRARKAGAAPEASESAPWTTHSLFRTAVQTSGADRSSHR